MVELLQACVPASYHSLVEAYLREALEEMRGSAHQQVRAKDSTSSPASGSSYLGLLWGTLMSLVLTFFFLSCVNQFAQLYQALIDKVSPSRPSFASFLTSSPLCSLRTRSRT
jgi:hypothetical protein